MFRKIAAVVVDRANYGRLRPVLLELQARPGVQLDLICTGTTLLEKFGRPVDIIKNDSLDVSSEIFMELEGNNFRTTAISVGLGITQFSNELEKLNPDTVLLIGDRYETLAAAIAAYFLKIPITHIQGGEVSGTLDEGTRHVITKLASLHFPATARAASILARLGESEDTIFNFGCPGGDVILEAAQKPIDVGALHRSGVGARIDIDKEYLLVVLHPDTRASTNYGDVAAGLLLALKEFNKQTIWLWPNSDAHADSIAKSIRVFREHNETNWLHVIKNVTPSLYAQILANAACAIGNSSSFVRDTCFTGTPVIIIGDRQQGRETGDNVLYSNERMDNFTSSLHRQLDHGHFKPSFIYGCGNSGPKIANKIASYTFSLDKKLSYSDVK